MSDIWTMIWKETKDTLLQGGRSALIRPLILIGFMGGLFPWQSGQNWLALAPAAILLVLYMPLFFVSTYIGDAIAGERERHTLETLLASRISDRAILLGKLIVAAGYAWSMVLVSLLLGLITANLVSGGGRWAFYASSDLLLESLALSLLSGLLAASAGVLISLRAATVRQAQQTLALSTLVLFVAALLSTRALPAQVLVDLSSNAPQFWLIVMAVLAILDAILLGATFARFQRSHLLLS